MSENANGSPNGNGDRMRKIADSTAALTFARLAMPILMTLVGAAGTIILWFGSETLKDVKNDIILNRTQLWAAVGKVTESQAETTRSLAVITTTLADHISRETDFDSDIKDRVKVLESNKQTGSNYNHN